MNKISIIILAAGNGTRMMSSKSKAMHTIGGKPLISHILDTAKKLNPCEIVTVIDETMEDVLEIVSNKTKISYQKEKLGTAHAVMCAKKNISNQEGALLILYVDTPLIAPNKLNELIKLVTELNNDIAVLAFEENKYNQYGRLIIDDLNRVKKIVEFNEANEEEKKVNLCNSGLMCFKTSEAFKIIDAINNNNSKKEFYLTDAIEIANNLGLKSTYIKTDKKLIQGANSKLELEYLEKTFQNMKRNEMLSQGVQLIDKASVYFSADTTIGKDVIVHPNVHFIGKNTIGNNVEILPFSVIQDSNIGDSNVIGPFARLREGTCTENDVKIGNFVETKKANIKKHTKINHLSYIGDSNVGHNTNIGAGTITCNYDGVNKNITTIGNNCFIGSNSALIAPLTIEDNATIAAGSVINKTVTKNTLAISRGKQKNIDNWKK